VTNPNVAFWFLHPPLSLAVGKLPGDESADGRYTFNGHAITMTTGLKL
jgi:hypothetical protein